VVIAETPFTWPLVLSHSVMSDGAPTAMNWSAPLITPSFITLGPATFTQLTCTSPSPAALPCFSTSLSRSMIISGRKETPYCWATAIRFDSAAAGNASSAASAPTEMLFHDDMTSS